MPRPQSVLTKYILSLPATLGPKAVVAKAKEKGFVTTEKNVHRVRAAKRKSAATPAVKKTAAPAKRGPKTSAKRGPRRGGGDGTRVNKSAFVRGLPDSMPAKEVVAKAKAAGITLNDKYVYNIRASHRASTKAGKKVGRATTTTTKKNATPSALVRGSGAKGGAEHTFVSASLDLGLTRATELLALLRDKVRSLTV